jgi:hypothetical protein
VPPASSISGKNGAFHRDQWAKANSGVVRACDAGEEILEKIEIEADDSGEDGFVLPSCKDQLFGANYS